MHARPGYIHIFVVFRRSPSSDEKGGSPEVARIVETEEAGLPEQSFDLFEDTQQHTSLLYQRQKGDDIKLKVVSRDSFQSPERRIRTRSAHQSGVGLRSGSITPKRPLRSQSRSNSPAAMSPNTSLDDLWTDEELFDDDSFILKATQGGFDGKSCTPKRPPKRKEPAFTPDRASSKKSGRYILTSSSLKSATDPLRQNLYAMLESSADETSDNVTVPPVVSAVCEIPDVTMCSVSTSHQSVSLPKSRDSTQGPARGGMVTRTGRANLSSYTSQDSDSFRGSNVQTGEPFTKPFPVPAISKRQSKNEPCLQQSNVSKVSGPAVNRAEDQVRSTSSNKNQAFGSIRGERILAPKSNCVQSVKSNPANRVLSNPANRVLSNPANRVLSNPANRVLRTDTSMSSGSTTSSDTRRTLQSTRPQTSTKGGRVCQPQVNRVASASGAFSSPRKTLKGGPVPSLAAPGEGACQSVSSLDMSLSDDLLASLAEPDDLLGSRAVQAKDDLVDTQGLRDSFPDDTVLIPSSCVGRQGALLPETSSSNPVTDTKLNNNVVNPILTTDVFGKKLQ